MEDLIKSEISKVIVGQRDMIDLLIASILANGHSLIEGVPGLGKTLLVRALARVVELSFKRVQYDPFDQVAYLYRLSIL